MESPGPLGQREDHRQIFASPGAAWSHDFGIAFARGGARAGIGHDTRPRLADRISGAKNGKLRIHLNERLYRSGVSDHVMPPVYGQKITARRPGQIITYSEIERSAYPRIRAFITNCTKV